MNYKNRGLSVLAVLFTTVILLKFAETKYAACTIWLGIQNIECENVVSLWSVNEDEIYKYITHAETYASFRLDSKSIKEIENLTVNFESQKIALSYLTITNDHGDALTYYSSEMYPLFSLPETNNTIQLKDGLLYVETAADNLSIELPAEICEEINAFRKK